MSRALLRRVARKLKSTLVRGIASSTLPVDFVPAIYLELNDDVRRAGVDPVQHYLTYGRNEGRQYVRPSLDPLLGHALDAARETVLIVTHDASRTGAPVLSLNLAQAFSSRYNVVTLILGKGSLLDQFQQASAETFFQPQLRRSATVASWAIDQLCKRHRFSFAVVNSIESRIVLEGLDAACVPSLSLLHEFSAYTRPRGAFREALFWSTESVFSTPLTLESVLADHPGMSKRFAHVIPQGKCVIPNQEKDSAAVAKERSSLAKQIRPEGSIDRVFVVLCAGAVQMRKGTDLFIDSAARVIRELGPGRCRFVWIGHGFDPDHDLNYSVYLADQIRRSGLQTSLTFVKETSELEFAYSLADVFFLSARLDPLPNVAIDAMTQGLPVLCFDKTTGIADYLTQAGLGPACVAPYLDTADIAKKIVALASAPDLLRDVGTRSMKMAQSTFQMAGYVSRLEALAGKARVQFDAEREDVAEIAASQLFDAGFAPPQASTADQAIRQYVRGWRVGFSLRKPYPGFHPGVYMAAKGLAFGSVDPFVHYLRAGQPKGPWHYNVLTPMRSNGPEPHAGRVALHVHAHYADMLPEILERLRLNRTQPELFISVNDEDELTIAREAVSRYPGTVADVTVVPNVGRDVGPLLTTFGARLVADYDIIGHVHTKKSLHLDAPETVNIWNRFLLENLLGGNRGGAMADATLAAMSSDPGIGIVFPDDPNVVGWSDNLPIAQKLAPRLGIDEKDLPEHFNFPVGTMFWARSSVLAPFVGLNLTMEDYPPEPLESDGTMLHAIERLLGLAAGSRGLRSASSHVPGISR